MENNMNGEYFFTIGSFEKNGFQHNHVENCKYIGRFKTKNKYLAVLYLFNVWLYTKKTFSYEVDLAFFDKYSDHIIGDVFFIEDNEVLEKLDKVQAVAKNQMLKENIVVTNQETSEELECFTYFRNCDDLEEQIEHAKCTINEYTIEEKIKALEVIIQLDNLKGKDTMGDFFQKMQKLKDEGQDLSKLLVNN